MMKLSDEFVTRSITWLFLCIFFGGTYFFSELLFSSLLIVSMLLALLFEWPLLFKPKNYVIFALVSLLYPILPFLTLWHLHYQYYHINWLIPLLPFLISWTADTCGYVVGKRLGRHKVCPSISPGKSWEGLAASFVGVYVVSLVLLPYIKADLFLGVMGHPISLFFLSAFLTVTSFLGGIFMSFLKRKKGLKDTGALLPGHGGILDRFDSVLPISVMMWIFLVMKHF